MNGWSPPVTSSQNLNSQSDYSVQNPHPGYNQYCDIDKTAEIASSSSSSAQFTPCVKSEVQESSTSGSNYYGSAYTDNYQRGHHYRHRYQPYHNNQIYHPYSSTQIQQNYQPNYQTYNSYPTEFYQNLYRQPKVEAYEISELNPGVPNYSSLTSSQLQPFGPPGFYDQRENLSTLDGVQCGVPTLTTPTLTPTTLRNIQQSFLQASQLQPQPPEQHSNQAGFMPPVVHPQPGSTFISIDSKSLGGGTATLVDTSTLHLSDSSTTIPSSTITSSGGSGPPPPLLPISLSGISSSHSVPIPGPTLATSSVCASRSQSEMPSVSITVTNPHCQTSRLTLEAPPSRRMGGRRPNNLNEHLSEEEEHKRRVRRERNKMAAARCRKRRLDQTMTLQEETDMLEEKKNDLQNEIQLLKQQKDELEFLLKHHKRDCRRGVGKSNVVVVTSSNQNNAMMQTSTYNIVQKPHNFMAKRVKREMVNPVPQNIFVKEEMFSDSEEYNLPDIPTSFSTMTMPVSSRGPLLISANNPVTTSITRTLANDGKPNRPTSLNVGPSRPTSLNVGPLTDIGVSIETPSNGLRGLNFDSMMDGGTGLTPVTPLAGSMVTLATGMTPLTTPIVAHPSASVSSLVVSSFDSRHNNIVTTVNSISSPDSIVPKHLVSL